MALGYKTTNHRALTDAEKADRGIETDKVVFDNVTERVQWGDLPYQRQSDIVFKSIRSVSLAAACVILFLTRGNTSDPVSLDEQRVKVADFIDSKYVAPSSTLDQFETSFVEPVSMEGRTEKGGNGWLGIISRGSKSSVVITVGQDCLAGTAYDTTASTIRGKARGDISAVASLNISETNTAEIHPAGSNADPLVFNISSDGRLKDPTPATANTLEAHGCAPESLAITEELSDYGQYEMIPRY